MGPMHSASRVLVKMASVMLLPPFGWSKNNYPRCNHIEYINVARILLYIEEKNVMYMKKDRHAML